MNIWCKLFLLFSFPLGRSTYSWAFCLGFIFINLLIFNGHATINCIPLWKTFSVEIDECACNSYRRSLRQLPQPCRDSLHQGHVASLDFYIKSLQGELWRLGWKHSTLLKNLGSLSSTLVDGFGRLPVLLREAVACCSTFKVCILYCCCAAKTGEDVTKVVP